MALTIAIVEYILVLLVGASATPINKNYPNMAQCVRAGDAAHAQQRATYVCIPAPCPTQFGEDYCKVD